MIDPNLSITISTINSKMWQLTIVFIVLAALIFAVMRMAVYFLIEKGRREKIALKINNSSFCQKLIWIFNPRIESIKGDDSQPLNVKYNKNSKQTSIKFKNEVFLFDGRRALIPLFFYNNQNEDKSYHDYNAWVKNNGYKDSETDSRFFRQEISEINGRLHKESKYIFSIIEFRKKPFNARVKANFYKYKIMLKK